jgi:hypothetical protein
MNTTSATHLVVESQLGLQITFDSMAAYWSEYYRQYLYATFPRVFVRFEDTIFHAEKVMETLSRCVGAERERPFQYYVERAKKFKQANDFVKALGKYGTAKDRYKGMTLDDLEYAKTALDPTLMQIFRYQHSPADLQQPTSI